MMRESRNNLSGKVLFGEFNAIEKKLFQNKLALMNSKMLVVRNRGK
jgi:hypothetical protein